MVVLARAMEEVGLVKAVATLAGKTESEEARVGMAGARVEVEKAVATMAKGKAEGVAGEAMEMVAVKAAEVSTVVAEAEVNMAAWEGRGEQMGQVAKLVVHGGRDGSMSFELAYS